MCSISVDSRGGNAGWNQSTLSFKLCFKSVSCFHHHCQIPCHTHTHSVAPVVASFGNRLGPGLAAIRHILGQIRAQSCAGISISTRKLTSRYNHTHVPTTETRKETGRLIERGDGGVWLGKDGRQKQRQQKEVMAKYTKECDQGRSEREERREEKREEKKEESRRGDKSVQSAARSKKKTIKKKKKKTEIKKAPCVIVLGFPW